MIKQIAAVGIVVLTSTIALAGTGQTARYQIQRIPMGPRPDQYIIVRVMDRSAPSDRPYALTGESQPARVHRMSVRTIPSHPKGTHGEY